MCAPDINCRARSSPALQLACAARRSVAPRPAQLGRGGPPQAYGAVLVPCSDSLPWDSWRAPNGGERICVRSQKAGWGAHFGAPPASLIWRGWRMGKLTRHQNPLCFQVFSALLATPCNRTGRGKCVTALTQQMKIAPSESTAYF